MTTRGSSPISPALRRPLAVALALSLAACPSSDPQATAPTTDAAGTGEASTDADASGDSSGDSSTAAPTTAGEMTTETGANTDADTDAGTGTDTDTDEPVALCYSARCCIPDPLLIADPDLPEVIVNGLATIGPRVEDRERLTTRMKLIELLIDMGYDAFEQSYPGDHLHANVVATLEATTPSDEYIIVGAHYDTVWGSPGAVDNGSGVAIVIAAADYLRHVKTRALNVMFVLFDEEEGVAYHEEYDYGAVNFITWFKDQELGTLHSAHTADMVSGWAGNPDVLYMHLVNNFYINLYTTALKRLRDAHGDALPLLNTMSIAGGTRGASDHYPFRAEGVDAFQLSSNSDRDLHPTWHSSADVAGVVNFEYLQAATLTTSAAIGGLLVCPN